MYSLDPTAYNTMKETLNSRMLWLKYNFMVEFLCEYVEQKLVFNLLYGTQLHLET